MSGSAGQRVAVVPPPTAGGSLPARQGSRSTLHQPQQPQQQPQHQQRQQQRVRIRYRLSQEPLTHSKVALALTQAQSHISVEELLRFLREDGCPVQFLSAMLVLHPDTDQFHVVHPFIPEEAEERFPLRPCPVPSHSLRRLPAMGTLSFDPQDAEVSVVLAMDSREVRHLTSSFTLSVSRGAVGDMEVESLSRVAGHGAWVNTRVFDPTLNAYVALHEDHSVGQEDSADSLVAPTPGGSERRFVHILTEAYVSLKTPQEEEPDFLDAISTIWDRETSKDGDPAGLEELDEQKIQEMYGLSTSASVERFAGVMSRVPPVIEEERAMRWASFTIPRNAAEVHVTLKNLIRRGVSAPRRRDLWLCLAGVDAMQQARPTLYERTLEASFGGVTYLNEEFVPSIVPEFGGNLLPLQHLLNSNGIRVASRLLCLISHAFPTWDYCPMLPDTVCLLLIHLSEREVFYAVANMLDKSSRAQWYFRGSLDSHRLFLQSFDQFLMSRVPRVVKHSIKLAVSKMLFEEQFSRLFVSFLPFQSSLRFLDSFLEEGNKMLYRMGYAICRVGQKQLLACSTAAQFEATLCKISLDESLQEELFKTCFEVKVRRTMMLKLDEEGRALLPVLTPAQGSSLVQSFVYYTPRYDPPSRIASEKSLEIYWSWVPRRLQIRDLKLLFATYRDGHSLSTLYHLSETEGLSAPCLLLLSICSSAEYERYQYAVHSQQERLPNPPKVQTVGAFCSTHWMRSFAYYGSGYTFVFSLTPEERVFRWSPASFATTLRSMSSSNLSVLEEDPPDGEGDYELSAGSDLASSNLSETNQYFLMGTNDAFLIGGGGDGPALRIDADLSRGSTHWCPTFQNEPLFEENFFRIMSLEMYRYL